MNTESLLTRTLALFHRQLAEWELAAVNYRQLKRVKSKELHFESCTIVVQFNPARMVSSAAQVDSKSVSERKCFLCPDYLPKAQQGISFGNAYQILVNPFPIFPFHLTIPVLKHEGQAILHRFGDMVELAQWLEGFTLFYNGPQCGASAPDHAHFQAGNRGFLPMEHDLKRADKVSLYTCAGSTLSVLQGCLRNALVLESADKESLVRLFNLVYHALDLKENEVEPMMNLLVWFDAGRWTCCIFPRALHRPACYSAEGEQHMLISPASVDLGGVFITPLEKDFEKITGEDVRKILREVCISDLEMNCLVERLKECL